ITSVAVRPRISPSRIYADFITDAKKYINLTGKECPAVPFPAYIPEYRSMKRAQLDFYFYFRGCVRKGERIESPLSYILLFLFEIINLPDMIKPEDGALYMCRILDFYGEVYPRLVSYISEWLCDYALIHKLSLPKEAIPMKGLLLKASSFPEFYLDPAYTDRFSLVCRAAHYTPDIENRYPETVALIREHLVRAIDTLSQKKRGCDFSLDEVLATTTGARTAYRSALCAYTSNALISYTYKSLSGNTMSAKRLCEICKYSENRVRAHLGIRARLKCPMLSDADRVLLDDYFDDHLPIERKKYIRKAPVTYMGENEHLYEPESVGISFDAARDIEKDSWKAAEMLEAAFEEYVTEPEVTEPADNELTALNETERELLRFVLGNDTLSLKSMLKQKGLIADAVVESINTYAFDKIGDSVIEGFDGDYTVVEDYITEVRKWIEE
ncbi:MAG: TerB N-terminal domain-containing protein, partial [Clostridia bacterium]|nr:TerB N-terminal domain-containing protein [Clostridia bacterium]